MLHRVRRHPLAIVAHFDYSLVLTYAWPAELLEALLPPGLLLDTHQGWGFVAVALVQTRRLRPAGLPAWLGLDFFLAGYRIFTRYRDQRGRNLRGLKILRSDTDRRLMVWLGNALTHYGYRKARLRARRAPGLLELSLDSPQAPLRLRAYPGQPAPLPPGSVFADWREARKFAGPLPFTFDYEKETRSMVIVEGVRQHWEPQPLAVEVEEAGFFRQQPFAGRQPLLVSAFLVEDIAYAWKPGRLERLS